MLPLLAGSRSGRGSSRHIRSWDDSGPAADVVGRSACGPISAAPTAGQRVRCLA